MNSGGYYPDFGLGIVIGLMCGGLVSAVLWAILFHQIQELRRSSAYSVDPLSERWITVARIRKVRKHGR